MIIKRYSVQWNAWFAEFGVNGWYPDPPGGWTEGERQLTRARWDVILGEMVTL